MKTAGRTRAPARARALERMPFGPGGLGLGNEPERLRPRPVAVPLLEPDPGRRGGAGHVEAAPAVTRDEPEEAAAERDRPPLLVRAPRPADRPELQGNAVADGPRAPG